MVIGTAVRSFPNAGKGSERISERKQGVHEPGYNRGKEKEKCFSNAPMRLTGGVFCYCVCLKHESCWFEFNARGHRNQAPKLRAKIILIII